jgi:ubiquinone/menaquinone biosynthesis C-methylase UbiE
MESFLSRTRSRMFEFYWTMEKIVVPGLNNSQYAYKEKLKTYADPERRWLDLGCGHQLFPEWMPGAIQEAEAIAEPIKQVVGIDRDFSSLAQHATFGNKVCGELHQLPFRDGSFDLITANMVIEHIEHPDVMLSEVSRVLKPRGVFLFHTPNKRGYSTLVTDLFPQRLIPHLSSFLLGRKAEDVYPTFYRLNTSHDIHSAATRNGLTVVECTYLESSAQARMLGPVVILELLLIKGLRNKHVATLRTNIIAVLQKLP